MTKSFRCEMRSFFQKQYKNARKKTITDIIERIGCIPNGQKSDMIEMITNFICSQIQQLKNTGKSVEQAVMRFDEICSEYDIKMKQRKQPSLDSIFHNFFTGQEMTTGRNARCNNQIVYNIWSDENRNYQCICPKPTPTLQSSLKEQPCYSCGKMCHIDCFWPKENDIYYECPMCFLKNCLPSKEVKQVLFAGYLRHAKKEKIEYKITFITDVKRDKLCYEARCVRLSKTNRFQFTWPQNCLLTFNKNRLTEFKPLNQNSPLKRRNDEQLKLQKCYLSQTGVNELVIQQRHTYIQGNRPNCHDDHLIMIVGTAPTVDPLLQKRFFSNKLSISDCKSIIMHYLDRGEKDVIIEKLTVSLTCPFYSTKINIPVRSRNCLTHYQPFDLKNFLMASCNSSKGSIQKWKCPICKKRAYDLVVDEYIYSFITQNANISEITFNGKGEPELVQEQQIVEQAQEQDDQLIERGCNQNQEQQLIDLDEDIIEEQVIVRQQSKASKKAAQNFIQICDQSDEDPEVGVQKRMYRERNVADSDEEEFNRIRKKKKLEDSEENVPSSSDFKNASSSDVKNGMDIENQGSKEREDKRNAKKSSKNQQNSDQHLIKKPLSTSKVLRNTTYNSKRDRDSLINIPISPTFQQSFPSSESLIKKPSVQSKDKVQIKEKQAVKKQMPEPIQIQSDSQSQESIEAKRLRFHLNELERQKTSFHHKQGDWKITPTDETIFADICKRFLNLDL